MKPMPGRSGGKVRIMAEINMIPFIDVALVLLIIFMIVTPFLVKSQIKVKLPTSKAVDSRLTREKMVQVQVQQDGAIFIDGQQTPPDEVEKILRAMLPSPDEQPVVIEADQDVAFKHVVVVLDAAKRIGATILGVCGKQEGADTGAGASRGAAGGGKSGRRK